jgi:pyrroloquinoline quinone biosynthesis protein B
MSRGARLALGGLAGLLALAGSASARRSPQAEHAPLRAVVLGVAQDGGVPHIGCQQELCVSARADPSRRQRVAALGLIDEAADRRFLIDATPDVGLQLEALNQGRPSVDRARPVDGILLTHAHIGHYTGLMYLGREALGAQRVPVYATPRMAGFLRGNGPWSQLVALEQIEIRELSPGQPLQLSPGLRVTPRLVPHRGEWSDVVGFRVEGRQRTLLYVPDIDAWEAWDEPLEAAVAGVDVALLDGTFEDAAELPGRSREDIPHPLVRATAARLMAARLAERTIFIHLNHTNRLLWDARARAGLETQGFRIAHEGLELPL